jgi:hypothetical protein
VTELVDVGPSFGPVEINATLQVRGLPALVRHIEAYSALVVSDMGLVISDCTTKQLNQRDEKPFER